MFRGDRADFPGQLRAADGLDLVGVNFETQAMAKASLQDLAGFLYSKGIRFAEHITEFGDALLLDGGHHLLADQADILRAVLLVLCRDQVAPIKVAVTSMGCSSCKRRMARSCFSSCSRARP